MTPPGGWLAQLLEGPGPLRRVHPQHGQRLAEAAAGHVVGRVVDDRLVVVVHREGQDVLVGEVGEGVVVVLRLAAPAPPVGQREGRRPLRVGGVRHVEQGHLEALVRLPVAAHVPADAQQQVVGDRLEVLGVAGDVQLAGHPGLLGVGQVDDEQRVDLVERHDVGPVADEPRRLEVLALRDVRCAADDRQGVAGLAQDVDGIAARVRAVVGDGPVVGGDAEVAGGAFVHRELVEDGPVHPAGRRQRDGVGAEGELEQLGEVAVLVVPVVGG